MGYALQTNGEKYPMTKKNILTLIKKLGYSFQDAQLLEQALSHRSSGKLNNERLEFLGDSLLNFVIASELFKKFQEAHEGQLSRLRAFMVREETLAEIASELQLNTHIRLGAGEMRSGGAERPSILSDTVEAIIGAIYLDSDMATCYNVVKTWFFDRLENMSLDQQFKDPKSWLQEIVQSKQLPLPEYTLIETIGKEHEQTFRVECKIGLLPYPTIGEGTSRRRAEQQAAELALKKIGEL
jgi:ribonuclease-3